MKALTNLLTELETIGAQHEELHDTDVREQMGIAVMEVFVHGNGKYELPGTYGMFSDEADRRVNEAMKRFAVKAASSTLDTEARVLALGPEGAVSNSGESAEYFFGALTEFDDDVSESPPGYLWWDSPLVYFGSMGVCGAACSWVISLFVPLLEVHPLWLLLVIVVCGVVAVAGGDAVWQFVANRTFRAEAQARYEKGD